MPVLSSKTKGLTIFVYSVLFDTGDSTTRTDIMYFDPGQLAGFKRSKAFKTVLDFKKLQQVQLFCTIKIY